MPAKTQSAVTAHRNLQFIESYSPTSVVTACHVSPSVEKVSHFEAQLARKWELMIWYPLSLLVVTTACVHTVLIMQIVLYRNEITAHYFSKVCRIVDHTVYCRQSIRTTHIIQHFFSNLISSTGSLLIPSPVALQPNFERVFIGIWRSPLLDLHQLVVILVPSQHHMLLFVSAQYSTLLSPW